MKQVVVLLSSLLKSRLFSNASESPFSNYWGGGGGGEGYLFEERRLIERGAYSIFFSTLLELYMAKY